PASTARLGWTSPGTTRGWGARRNEVAMTDQPLPEAKFFGAYCQVSDLRRSVEFYRDVMGLHVTHSDDTLAILHARNNSEDSVILRTISAPPHRLGETGVTRLFWRVRERDDINAAEEGLARHGITTNRRQ